MKSTFLARVAGDRNGEREPDFRVKIFRLLCALTGTLCLVVVAPLNAVQNLPLAVNAATVALGLLAWIFFWQSHRNRHYFLPFLLSAGGLLDFAWFWNAGSQGSVGLYYYPLLLFIFALFEGRARWLLAVGLLLNVFLLFVLEYYMPGWITPFRSGSDRLIDLITGVFCSFAALAGVSWFVLRNYAREQRRVIEIAAKLTASEAHYRKIFNSTSDALFVHAPDGRILDANEQACVLFGIQRDELLALSGVETLSLNEPPYTSREARRRLDLALQGQAQQFDWRSRRRNGELFWSEVALRVWELEGEKRVIASVRDITQRIKAQEETRRSEERLRLAILASSQSWFEANLLTGRTVSSPEYARMLGYDTENFETSLELWKSRIHPDDRSAVLQEFQQALSSGSIGKMEYRLKKKTGEWIWCRSVGKVVETDEMGRPVRLAGTHRDITESRQYDQALRLNEERLRLAMEASRQGWFELNVATGESASSPEFVRLLGYEPEEFQSSVQAWIERVHPADRAEVLAKYQRGIAGHELSPIEYRQRTKSGAWRWFRSGAKVVERDAAGHPLRLMGTHTDITERKELESQLLHSQRLEAVGSLASGVAHDLNNILTPMLMASGLLRDKLAEQSDRDLMRMLDEGGRRGAAIVRQLLAFSRNLAQDRVPVDPLQQLRELAQLMRSSLPKEIRVVESFAEVSGLIEAEPNQLHQVLMNLCVNARDAMPDGGTLTLALERVDVAGVSEVKDGPFLVLRVADTGHGIPAEVMERIFDPFFTTKPLGKGTGLGLATVHGIVKAHRGFVRVTSEVGRGTEFLVFLPARDGLAPAAAETTTSPLALARRQVNATILLVDDEVSVLTMTSRLLQRAGHQVLAAKSGIEALNLLGANRENVALVVTDFSMPGMDGPTMAAKMRELRPGLRILGISGVSQSHRQAELSALGFVEVLAKPFEMDDLMRAVQGALSLEPGAGS